MDRVLLDTNIIIHRETSRVIKDDIGKLFNWLNRLGYNKLINSLSIEEINKYQDQQTVESFKIKMESYQVLETQIPWHQTVKRLSGKLDTDQNSINDTKLINDLVQGRTDFIITEDRGIHKKAELLGISEYVYTVTDFIEKLTVENPSLAEYEVLSIEKEKFGNIDIEDSFFDSFKEDYKGFKKWFFSKSEDEAYVCYSDENELVAFLYLKAEGLNENYNNIEPVFSPAKRLKVGTFKVILTGFKIGERFMKIIFDNAIENDVDQIYLTIFGNTFGQEQLISLIEDWGFVKHGIKTSSSGEEEVYVRDFEKSFKPKNPQLTFPYFGLDKNIFIVPIYPQYHTELLPDSILTTEEKENYVAHKPNRYAIRKVYISRSYERNLNPGDIIVFYRTKHNGPAHYTSVATTVGVVQSKHDNIKTVKNFINLCRKRSVFTDEELKKHWNYSKNNRPFVVNFLYVHSFPNRLNLKQLKESEIIESAPRGFEKMSKTQFKKLYELSNGDQRLIVN